MLNQEETIIALEHCIVHNCYGCPLNNGRYCGGRLEQAALTTILTLQRKVKFLENGNKGV